MSKIKNVLLSMPTAIAASSGSTSILPTELVEVVFNASGNFTVPSDAVDNEFYVGCTGGGAGALDYDSGPDEVDRYYLAGGSGRTSKILALTPGTQIAVIVGSGGVISNGDYHKPGGTSSFGTYVTCSGSLDTHGINGGGNSGDGVKIGNTPAPSNCPAMFTLKEGALDNTTGLYKAKSYRIGDLSNDGGPGCYGTSGSNTGAGGGDYNGGSGYSGKVVIYYYRLRAAVYTFTASSTTKTFKPADMFTAVELSTFDYFIINVPEGITLKAPMNSYIFDFSGYSTKTFTFNIEGTVSGGDGITTTYYMWTYYINSMVAAGLSSPNQIETHDSSEGSSCWFDWNWDVSRVTQTGGLGMLTGNNTIIINKGSITNGVPGNVTRYYTSHLELDSCGD